MNTQEVQIKRITPLFSGRTLAIYLDLFKRNGEPSIDSVRDFVNKGLIPPPDYRLSRKAYYWKPSSIENFLESGRQNAR